MEAFFITRPAIRPQLQHVSIRNITLPRPNSFPSRAPQRLVTPPPTVLVAGAANIVRVPGGVSLPRHGSLHTANASPATNDDAGDAIEMFTPRTPSAKFVTLLHVTLLLHLLLYLICHQASMI